jgi:hypothetical protein
MTGHDKMSAPFGPTHEKCPYSYIQRKFNAFSDPTLTKKGEEAQTVKTPLGSRLAFKPIPEPRLLKVDVFL